MKVLAAWIYTYDYLYKYYSCTVWPCLDVEALHDAEALYDVEVYMT